MNGVFGKKFTSLFGAAGFGRLHHADPISQAAQKRRQPASEESFADPCVCAGDKNPLRHQFSVTVRIQSPTVFRSKASSASVIDNGGINMMMSPNGRIMTLRLRASIVTLCPMRFS